MGLIKGIRGVVKELVWLDQLSGHYVSNINTRPTIRPKYLKE